MDTLMILFAQYLYVVIILMLIVFLLLQKRKVQKEILIFSAVIFPIAYVVAKIASHFYYNPRPFVVMHIKPLIQHAATNGFPSDHTLISAAIAAVLFLFNKKWGIVAAILSLLVGISRIYVHVHSPIDIVGSFVIAFGVAIPVRFILAKYLPKEQNPS